MVKVKKFYKLFALLLINISILSACNYNNNEIAIIEDTKEKLTIQDGKYISSENDSYVEITDGKYFQLINWNEDDLEKIRRFYAQDGYENIVIKSGGKFSADELTKIKQRCDNSTQIVNDLINNKAEFIINRADESISQMMIEDIGTDTEITYLLDDYELWFPFYYYYLNDEYKLVSQQFGLEYYLEK